MKITIAKILFGAKVVKLVGKIVQYRSKKSDGGRKLTKGERAYLGRLYSEVGEAFINILIKEGKTK